MSVVAAPGSFDGFTPAFWSGRRVFVTGHTGFKGSWLVAILSRLGAVVEGYGLAPATDPNMRAAIGAAGLCGSDFADVRDWPTLKERIEAFRPEIVFHMAAQPLVRRSYRDPRATFEVNVLGAVNLLEACRALDGIDAIVNVTTDKVYEVVDGRQSYEEADRLGGADPYSASKACSELVAASYRASFAERATADGRIFALATARSGNVIGGGDWSEDRLIPDAVRAFSRGEEVVLRNPKHVRPWQHVLDALLGYLTLAQAVAIDGPDSRYCSAWNFGPPEGYIVSVQKVMNRFVSAWGDGARLREAPDGDWRKETDVLSLDSARARAALGWRTRLPLDQAIAWSAEWYRAFVEGASEADMLSLTNRQIDQVLADFEATPFAAARTGEKGGSQ